MNITTGKGLSTEVAFVYQKALIGTFHDSFLTKTNSQGDKIYIFDSDLFLCTRNLKNKRLKPVFEYKIT